MRSVRPLGLLVLALTACAAGASPDPANATFTIEGQKVTLVGGRAERAAAPGSTATVVTTLGDQRAQGDFDGDGRQDVAVTLVHQPGGSGTFIYVALLLNPQTGATATNAVLIGDRIKVNAVRADGTAAVVEFMDRRPGEPLSAAPSVLTTKRLVVRDGKLAAQ